MIQYFAALEGSFGHEKTQPGHTKKSDKLESIPHISQIRLKYWSPRIDNSNEIKLANNSKIPITTEEHETVSIKAIDWVTSDHNPFIYFYIKFLQRAVAAARTKLFCWITDFHKRVPVQSMRFLGGRMK